MRRSLLSREQLSRGSLVYALVAETRLCRCTTRWCCLNGAVQLMIVRTPPAWTQTWLRGIGHCFFIQFIMPQLVVHPYVNLVAASMTVPTSPSPVEMADRCPYCHATVGSVAGRERRLARPDDVLPDARLDAFAPDMHAAVVELAENPVSGEIVAAAAGGQRRMSAGVSSAGTILVHHDKHRQIIRPRRDLKIPGVGTGIMRRYRRVDATGRTRGARG